MSDPTTTALAELRAALARVAELDAKAAKEISAQFDRHDDAAFVVAASSIYPRLAAVVAAMLAVCDNLDQPGRHPDRRQVAESVRGMAVSAWRGDL